MSEIEEAKNAVARAATHLAQRITDEGDETAGEIKGRADALDVVAGAVSKVAHGPQGGGWESNISYHYPGPRNGRAPGFHEAQRAIEGPQRG